MTYGVSCCVCMSVRVSCLRVSDISVSVLCMHVCMSASAPIQLIQLIQHTAVSPLRKHMARAQCLRVCVYVCMCVCVSAVAAMSVSACLHVLMSVCLRVCMSACMRVCMSACLYVCMSACLRVCICLECDLDGLCSGVLAVSSGSSSGRKISTVTVTVSVCLSACLRVMCMHLYRGYRGFRSLECDLGGLCSSVLYSSRQ
jgi:hypothetical protein